MDGLLSLRPPERAPPRPGADFLSRSTIPERPLAWRATRGDEISVLDDAWSRARGRLLNSGRPRPYPAGGLVAGAAGRRRPEVPPPQPPAEPADNFAKPPALSAGDLGRPQAPAYRSAGPRPCPPSTFFSDARSGDRPRLSPPSPPHGGRRVDCPERPTWSETGALPGLGRADGLLPCHAGVTKSAFSRLTWLNGA